MLQPSVNCFFFSLSSEFAQCKNPAVAISVLNSKRQLLEPVKLVSVPLQFAEGGQSVQWLAYWHMQTPVETVEAGSFVLFEFKSLAAAPSPGSSPVTAGPTSDSSNLCWGVYPLALETVDSVWNHSVALHSYPLNLDALSSSNPVAKKTAKISFGVILSRRSNAVDMQSILNHLN